MRRRPAPSFMDLLLDAAAVARVARLLTVDEIPALSRPRNAIQRAYPPHGATLSAADGWDITETDAPFGYTVRPDGHRITGFVQPVAGHPALIVDEQSGSALGYFVTCPWCTGIYVAACVSLARRYLPRAWDPVARFLALAHAAGALNNAL